MQKIMQKVVLALSLILTSEPRVEHPFAGRNTQQLFLNNLTRSCGYCPTPATKMFLNTTVFKLISLALRHHLNCLVH